MNDLYLTSLICIVLVAPAKLFFSIYYQFLTFVNHRSEFVFISERKWSYSCHILIFIQNRWALVVVSSLRREYQIELVQLRGFLRFATGKPTRIRIFSCINFCQTPVKIVLKIQLHINIQTLSNDSYYIFQVIKLILRKPNRVLPCACKHFPFRKHSETS